MSVFQTNLGDDLPAVQSNYDSRLLTIFVGCFLELLRSAHSDDRSWQKLSEGIHRHGLLSFMIDIPRKERLPEIDAERLETDRNYRRKISRMLARPLPPDYQQGAIPLHRQRLSDPVYLRKMAGILGYRWQQKMATERADQFDKIVLLHTDASDIAECLEKMFLHQSTAKNVSACMMRRFAAEEMDRDPKVQEIFCDLSAKLDVIEARYNQEVDERLARIKEDTRRQLAAIVERIQRRPQISGGVAP